MELCNDHFVIQIVHSNTVSFTHGKRKAINEFVTQEQQQKTVNRFIRLIRTLRDLFPIQLT